MSEAKRPMDARKDPALMTAAERPRLSWPAAALVIVGLSVAGWVAVALVMGRLLH